MSSPRHTVRKSARKPRNVLTREVAAARVEREPLIDALVGSVAALQRAFPDRAAELAAWVSRECSVWLFIPDDGGQPAFDYEVQQTHEEFVRVRRSPRRLKAGAPTSSVKSYSTTVAVGEHNLADVVRAIFAWFMGVRDLHEGEREAFDSVDAMTVSERKLLGRQRRRLISGMRAVEDNPSLRAQLEQVKTDLPALPERESRPRPGVSIEKQVGGTLMSMMLAAGYGAGLDGQRYSTPVAANLISKAAASYGFDIPASSLITWAVELKKS